MALDIFMVQIWELKANHEMLTAQAELRGNEFVCQAKQNQRTQRKVTPLLEKKQVG